MHILIAGVIIGIIILAIFAREALVTIVSATVLMLLIIGAFMFGSQLLVYWKDSKPLPITWEQKCRNAGGLPLRNAEGSTVCVDGKSIQTIRP